MTYDAASDLTVQVSRPSADTVTVTVIGDIYLSTIETLSQAIRDAAVRFAPPVLALDVSGVKFCDCCGLGALIGARRDLRDAGTRLVITVVSPAVAFLLSIFDLGPSFGLAETSRRPWTMIPPRRRRWPSVLRRALVSREDHGGAVTMAAGTISVPA
jgi:anti-anti-sigma factor